MITPAKVEKIDNGIKVNGENLILQVREDDRGKVVINEKEFLDFIRDKWELNKTAYDLAAKEVHYRSLPLEQKKKELGALKDLYNSFPKVKSLNLFASYTCHVNLKHYGIYTNYGTLFVTVFIDGRGTNHLVPLRSEDIQYRSDEVEISIVDKILRVRPVNETYDLCHIHYIQVL